MKVTKERNPYLKRIFSQTPHKYSFDIDSGKHYLIDEQGKPTCINPNGTLPPKFRENYSGFVDHHTRYKDALNDPSVLHFAPDASPKSKYHHPLPQKYQGYAQSPYKLYQQLPSYLSPHNNPRNYPRPKAQSLILSNKQIEDKRKAFKSKFESNSAILEHSVATEGKDPYFATAWRSMSENKPLPKQKKRTCYNYRCKYMKQWVFDQRGKIQQGQGTKQNLNLGRSFHESSLTRELQEEKLLSTMALSGVA